MADYQPLIARAIAGLEKNTGENRRVLYERARTALVAQLRGVQPALDESEITRERLALEEAIRKVEADAARQARETMRPPTPPRRPPPPRREPPPRLTPMPSTPPPEPLHEPGAHEQHEPEPDFVIPPAPPSQPPHQPEEFGQLEPAIRQEDLWEPERRRDAPLNLDGQRPAGRPRTPPPRFARDEAEEEEVERPARRRIRMPEVSGRMIRNGAIALGVLVIAGLIWWQRDTIAGATSSMMAMIRSPASTPAPRDPTPAARPKISDRIGQPGSQPAGLPVAQRVVLYEEDPDDPQGKRFVGNVVWRTETMPGAPGRSPELALRADVDIPERKMTVTWSLRRNSDPSLPASHTIEIMFNLPTDSPTGGVQNVPGVLMKQAEQTRGVPLAGLAVKVTPGFFLIGLSALESDMQRNVQLLKERPWFDIPIVYNTNRRAILALEKGNPGERAFTDAFAAWRQ